MILDETQMRSAKSSAPKWESASVPPYTRLALPTPSSIWRYDFFNHDGAAVEDYAVALAAPTATAAKASSKAVFHRVEGVPGPYGEVSLAFESSRPIPLTARPQERFMLVHRQQPLIAELPTPELDFCRDRGHGGLCARLFIYL